MNSQSGVQSPKPDWYANISKYSQSSTPKATWQLVNTIVPYILLWILMVKLIKLGYSYWIVLPISFLAAAFLVRIFIFFHDCGHGSFLPSRQANKIVGYICGVLTFTPFDEWRNAHAKHHVTAGDLDRRGTGDVWTLTLDEYLAQSKFKRLVYRFYRHPIIMFGFGSAYVFLINHRIFHKGAKTKERYSVILTNLILLVILFITSLTFGLREYLMIQIPTILFAGMMGIWLFYVQHQFEGVYWARHEQWDPIKAALNGSSYYKLPKVLQWFSGNIGLHHIHHVRPAIPNYNLQKCYNEISAFQEVKPLRFGKSIRSIWMNVWDEKKKKLVSFHSIRKQSNQGQFI